MADDLPLVLHVGGPKAGSSALQYDFTWNPRRPAHGRPGVTYEYVALNARGQLRRGPGLEEMASRFAAHYANSAAIESLLALPATRLAPCLEELHAMRREGIVPILSYELWLHADPALVERFVNLLEAPLEVIAYVRDPVSWLTSAYWQRHEAEATTIDDWLAAMLPLTRWADHLAVWRAQPAVERLAVRPADGSVAEDFCRVIGCPSSQDDVRHNVALPGPFARFLTRFTLPPTTSVSELKFAWWRWVRSADNGSEGVAKLGSLPRVIGQPQLDTIITATDEANRQLLALCDPATAARIEQDRRWWSTDERDHRLGLPGETRSAAEAIVETDRLLALSLQATMAADTAWRRTTYELAESRRQCAELAARDLAHQIAASHADHERQVADHRCQELDHQRQQLEHRCRELDHQRQQLDHRCRELDHRCRDLEWHLVAAQQRIAKLERRGCLPHPWRKAA